MSFRNLLERAALRFGILSLPPKKPVRKGRPGIYLGWREPGDFFSNAAYLVKVRFLPIESLKKGDHEIGKVYAPEVKLQPPNSTRLPDHDGVTGLISSKHWTITLHKGKPVILVHSSQSGSGVNGMFAVAPGLKGKLLLEHRDIASTGLEGAVDPQRGQLHAIYDADGSLKLGKPADFDNFLLRHAWWEGPF